MKDKKIENESTPDIKVNVGVADTGESICTGNFKIGENTADIELTVKDENTAEAVKEATKILKKASLEQLIQKKLEKDGKINAIKEIYVKSLDSTITVNNPSDTQKIEFADKTKTGSYVDMMEAYSRLIYDCCPMLRSKELQQSIGVNYPYDTVKAIFDTDEIAEIGVKVLNFFDNEEEDDSDEKLKN